MKDADRLRKVQLLMLEIAKELKRVCEKNNIRYFLMWGTLLGAVRHGGFIPWDDDMDFGMLREDYEKFIEACKKDLDPRFFLQTWDTDPNFPLAFAKLRLNGTHFLEKFSEKAQMNNGIFIDIFPLDHVPDSDFANKVRSSRCFVCERLMWLKKGMGKNIKEESLGGKIKYNVFYTLSKVVPYEWLKKHYEKILRGDNAQKTGRVDGPTVFHFFGVTGFSSKWPSEIEEIPFETTQFPAFKDKEGYLTFFYGDYMTPPPEEERVGHLPVEIDFGPYASSQMPDDIFENK